MPTTTLPNDAPDTLAPHISAHSSRLRDADPATRRLAIAALADLEDVDALPPIAAALAHDVADDVRREAASALSDWDIPWVADALCRALLDRDAAVRDAAAASLAALKDPVCGTVLCEWAEHSDPIVKAAALRALRSLRVAGAFLPALAALRHDNANVRFEAVCVLGWLKDARALRELAACSATDTDADVRCAAVGALGFGPADEEALVSALLGALRDGEWRVREEAATTLGKLRACASNDALIAALDDDYWQVRLRAARALGQIGLRHAVEPLCTLLVHPISNLRKEAALALGTLGDRTALHPLCAALDDADPEVRKAARIAVRQIEEASP